MTTYTFHDRLANYKQSIDDDIAAYAAYASKHATEQFGMYGALEVGTFLDILKRGGKRIRGALVMHGYHMCGGTDQKMIIQAARAIEMLHAYMLIIDDIQDRSAVRRGQPSAHMLLANYHRRHKLKGDAYHLGISLAINAAIAGNHAAQTVLANLNADPQLRLNALSITNRTLAITAHGQTYDVIHAVLDQPDPADVERVLEWKSALYSFINPLHVGMVLAGADCHDTDAITPYALHVGKAFQITDDIISVFGQQSELGKNPIDDIREGKHTVLVQYAFTHGASKDVAALQSALGNARLTKTAFERCKRILTESGALAHAKELAQTELEQALTALDVTAQHWPAADVQFLRDLAVGMVARTK